MTMKKLPITVVQNAVKYLSGIIVSQIMFFISMITRF
jgi:hypothetical protein